MEKNERHESDDARSGSGVPSIFGTFNAGIGHRVQSMEFLLGHAAILAFS